MNLREGSKFAVAILGSVMFAAFCNWLSGKVVQVKYLERPAYQVPGLTTPEVDLVALRRNWPQALNTPSDRTVLIGYMRDIPQQTGSKLAPEGTTSAVEAVEELPDFATAIPAASPAAGQQVAERCGQCHNWDKNGPNKIGPNLYGVIGRIRGTHEGFSYSSAMRDKAGPWTYEDLFRYLKSPARFVPGNKMTFAGLSRAQERLNLIAYMRSWADKPPALPPAGAKP